MWFSLLMLRLLHQAANKNFNKLSATLIEIKSQKIGWQSASSILKKLNHQSELKKKIQAKSKKEHKVASNVDSSFF
jgi:hypothetical protein